MTSFAPTSPRPAPTRSAAAPAVRTRPVGREWFAHVPPNWFAAVMGTGIIANATASLPGHLPGLAAFGIAMWLLAATLLVAVTAGTVAHWVTHPARARAHLHNPVLAHFYGAPPMALLTVGAGTLLVGHRLIGLHAAVAVDWALWVAGTALGLVTAVAGPVRLFTRVGGHGGSAPFGGWLMPVVPPMVSAATGALLLPHTAAGQGRQMLLWCCYAMFGLSLLASLFVISLIWGRLALGDLGPAALVPTLFIVLGPLGQSVTASGLLGGNAHLAVPPAFAGPLSVLAVAYGVPVMGFALLWAAIATWITLSTVRRGLPFTLTWWSFTFPVGTCVTGLSALARRTGLDAFSGLAVAGFLVLAIVWIAVAVRTTLGVARGSLLAPPA